MRAFLAVELDADARRAVAGLQERIRASLGRGRRALRLVRPEQLHVTLVFLGDLSDRDYRALGPEMRVPIRQAPYELKLSGLGTFPPRGAPKVLWLGIAAGARETVAVQAEMRVRLERAGVAVPAKDGGRPFTPHLTLGRWREARPAVRRLSRDLAAAAERVASSRIDEVTLFRSEVSDDGATYTPLVRTRLAGS